MVKQSLRENAFVQFVQWKGFSLEWVLKCVVKLFLTENALLHRQAKFMELKRGVELKIKVHGMTNMAVGQIIDFEMLVVGETHGKEKVDPYYSGKYLITQLRHEFNEVPQRHHSIFMTIVKDGYKKELEKNTDAKEPKKRSKGVVNRNAA